MNELLVLKTSLKNLAREAMQCGDPPTPAQVDTLIDRGCEVFDAALELIASIFQRPAP